MDFLAIIFQEYYLICAKIIKSEFMGGRGLEKPF